MSDAPTTDRPMQRWYWLVPAATFLVGLLLGVVVMAATGGNEDTPSAAPIATTAAPSPGASATPRTVTIPVSCEQGLERAQEAMSTIDEAVDALRRLQTARLQELLDRLQDAEREVGTLIEQCRQRVPQVN